jgi:hypothetical protein
VAGKPRGVGPERVAELRLLHEAGLLVPYYDGVLERGMAGGSMDWPGGGLPRMEDRAVAKQRLRGTAKAILDVLGEIGPVRDDTGHAGRALAERLSDRGVKVTGSAVSQQLTRLERDGHLERTTKGKLCYAIALPGRLGDAAGAIPDCPICRRSPGGRCLAHKDPEDVLREARAKREAAEAAGRSTIVELPTPVGPRIGDVRPAPAPAPRAAPAPPVEVAYPAAPVLESGLTVVAALMEEQREELLELRGRYLSLVDELADAKRTILGQAELVGNLRAQIAVLRGTAIGA